MEGLLNLSNIREYQLTTKKTRKEKLITMIIKYKAMKIKFILSILLLVLMILLCSACNNDNIQYTFPLSQEDVEQVFNKQQLSWNLEVNQPYQKNQTIYVLKNAEGVFCVVESRSNEGEKYLSLSLKFPINYSTDQMRRFNELEMSRLLNNVSMLYGNSKIDKKVFRDFSTYFDGKKSKEDGSLLWTKRMGDDHYKLTLYPKGDEYQLYNFSIMNSVAYERLISGYATAMRKTQNNDYMPLNKGTVSSIKDMESLEEKQDIKISRFIVRGYLKDIHKTAGLPDSFKMMSDNYLPPNKEGYLSATLVDDTGSIEVFLRPTSLNEDELNKERDHYVYFYNVKEPFCVVQLSVLGE